jgi:hypothetical protein
MRPPVRFRRSFRALPLHFLCPSVCSSSIKAHPGACTPYLGQMQTARLRTHQRTTILVTALAHQQRTHTPRPRPRSLGRTAPVRVHRSTSEHHRRRGPGCSVRRARHNGRHCSRAALVRRYEQHFRERQPRSQRTMKLLTSKRHSLPCSGSIPSRTFRCVHNLVIGVTSRQCVTSPRSPLMRWYVHIISAPAILPSRSGPDSASPFVTMHTAFAVLLAHLSLQRCVDGSACIIAPFYQH